MSGERTVSFFSWIIVGFFVFGGLVIFGFILFVTIVMPTPPNRSNFTIYSKDMEHCVSVITMEETRYIINGEHKSVPKEGYIKIDVNEIPGLGDSIGVCWDNDGYEWEIVNDRSNVQKNRLDTLKYKFNTSWEKDNRGIPNTRKYIKSNCGIVDIETMRAYISDGIILVN